MDFVTYNQHEILVDLPLRPLKELLGGPEVQPDGCHDRRLGSARHAAAAQRPDHHYQRPGGAKGGRLPGNRRGLSLQTPLKCL